MLKLWLEAGLRGLSMGKIGILIELAGSGYKVENVVSFCAWRRKHIISIKLRIYILLKAETWRLMLLYSR